MTPRPILYCDVDSTLNDHWRRIQRNSVRSGPDAGFIQPSAFTEAEVMKDEPLPDAARVLQRFRESGWEVHYLTSRNWDPEGSVTQRWLQKHEFPHSYVHIVDCHHAKIEFLRRHRCELFLDDFTVGQENKAKTQELKNPKTDGYEFVSSGFPDVTLRQDLIEQMPCPYEVVKTFENPWPALDAKYFARIPNGEFFWQFMVRNLEWWRVNREHERTSRTRYYENFLKAVGFKPELTNSGKILAEIGAGPFGGVIKGLPARQRIFYDVLANAQRVLRFADWGPEDFFVDLAAESLQDVPMAGLESPANSQAGKPALPRADVLVSYNALDHGWDIRAALRGAVHASKEMWLAFDCKADTAPAHDRVDHYQIVRFEEVRQHVNDLAREGLIRTFELGDLRDISPGFHFEHNWGFPVFWCHAVNA